MKHVRALLAACATVTVPVIGSTPARAADATWDGGGADDFTNTAANWAGDLTPAAMDALIFDGAVRTTPDNNIAAGTSFRGITFAAGASPFTLNGNAITLESNTRVVGVTNVFTGILNDSLAAQTVNPPLTLAFGDHLIAGGTAGLTLNGAITRNTGSVARFTGTVSAPALVNDSTGIIGNWATIGGDHAVVGAGGQIVPYTGYVELGDTPASIPSDATKNFRWTKTTAGQTYTLPSGVTAMNTLTFTNNTGVTLLFAADSTLRFGPSGGIFRASTIGGANINIGSFATTGVGAITAGGADNTPGELSLNFNNGGIIIRPRIVDNGTGAVTLVARTLPGQSIQLATSNSYSGGTYVAGGILRGTEPTSFGTGPIHVAASSQVWLDPFNATTPEASVFNNEFFLSGVGSDGGGGLNEGALRIARQAVVAGNINLLTDSRIQFRGTTGVGARIDGKITGPHALKLGGGGALQPGTLTLTNSANDWTGDTSIDIGVAVKVGGTGEVIPNGAGKGNLTWSAGTGTFDLNGKTETINGLISRTATDLIDPTLDNHVIRNTGATPAQLIVGDNDANASFGFLGADGIGGIQGDLAVTKIGAGTQVFGGNNTYTGNTTMAGGVLSVGASASVGAATNTFVFNGGTLHTSAGVDFARNVTVNAGGGTFDTGGFDSSVNNVTGTGGFTKSGAGKLTANQVKIGGAVAVGGGTLEIPANGTAGGMLESSGLTVAGGAILAMNDNDFIVNYGLSDPSPEFTLRDYVKAFADNPAATSGISFTPGAGDVTIAVAEKTEWGFSTFNGVTLDDTTVIGKYTYYGDSNLDGAVTSDDYVAVDVGLGTGDSWVQGDFNFSGSVTSDDYVAIDVNLGKGSPTPLAFAELKAEMVALHTAMFGDEYVQKLAIAEAEGYAALVPEPGALSLVGLAAAGLLGRRRHIRS